MQSFAHGCGWVNGGGFVGQTHAVSAFLVDMQIKWHVIFT